MKNANIYSELLDILQGKRGQPGGCIFGTLTGTEPLTVRVGDREISRGLFHSREKMFHVEQIGEELALLPCENGLLILFEVEEAT